MTDPLESSRYQIVRRLAVGGMGEVLLCRSEGDERIGLTAGLVVVKRTIPRHPNMEHQNQMLLEEGRIALRLRHANLVETFCLDEAGGAPILVMEYLAGRSMAQVLGAAKRHHEEVPVDVALAILREAACGLHFAHTLRDGATPLGLVHRDVSPANVFGTFDGRVKVIDFGVAKADDSEIKTSTGVLKGKIGYMSPEHTLGEKLTPRADLWSLGVVLWETLVADRLFSTANPALTLHKINTAPIPPPSTVRAGIPPSVEQLCMALLTRSPEERIGSGEELVQRIDSLPDVDWRAADVGSFLRDRFPEEAHKGVKEVKQAATVRGTDVPSGLISGLTMSDEDIEAATVVAERRDLIELARAAMRETAGQANDDDDDLRTVQLSAAEVRELTGGMARAPGPNDGPAFSPSPITGLEQDAPPSGLDGLFEDVELSKTTTTGQQTVSGRKQLTSEEDDPADRTLALTDPLSASSDSMVSTAPQAQSSSGAAEAIFDAATFKQEPAPGPSESQQLRVQRRAGAAARRRAPSASAVAFGTFGGLACAMGLLFTLLQSQPPPRVLSYESKAGPDILVAAIDRPENVSKLHEVDLAAPRLVTKSGRRELVDPERVARALEEAGVSQRAILPAGARGQFAAGLPPLFLVLGLLALGWALPAFMVGGSLVWVLRAVLLIIAMTFAGYGLQMGLLGWPGLQQLKAPPAHVNAGQL